MTVTFELSLYDYASREMPEGTDDETIHEALVAWAKDRLGERYNEESVKLAWWVEDKAGEL